MRGSRANLRAASAAASRCSRVVVSKTIPSVLARGNASRTISTRLAASSIWRTKRPVTLPPGRLRLRVKIDCQKCDRLAACRSNRGTQRRLVADGQEHVDLARGERVIVLFVAFDI